MAVEGADISHYLDWSTAQLYYEVVSEASKSAGQFGDWSNCLQIFFNSLSEQRNILSSCVPEAFDIHSVVIMNEDVAHRLASFAGKSGMPARRSWDKCLTASPII